MATREQKEAAIDKILGRLESQDAGIEYLNGTGAVSPDIEKAIEADIAHEIKLEEKYGDHPVEAALGSAASAATLGLSDQTLRKMGISAERLSETRERSPVASGIGTGIGIIAPALVGDEAGLIGSATKAVSAPLEGATALGKMAAQGTEKLVEGRVRSKAMQEILKNTAQYGTEGALIGGGQLLSEDALGKADLNAQNLVASAGAGAMLGGGFGGLVGATKAAMPAIGRGIAPITDKLKGAAKSMIDPEIAAAELVGINPQKMAKINEYRPTFASELPEYLTNKLDLKALTTADELVARNQAIKAAAGTKIGDTIKALDAEVVANPTLLGERLPIYDRLLNKLQTYQDRFAASPSAFKAELGTVEGFATDLHALARKSAPNSLKELDDLRKLYQKVKYKGGGALESFRAEVAESLRQELRNVVDETASRIATNTSNPATRELAEGLKAANKDYYTASLIEKYLPKKLNGKALLGLQDLVEGTVVGGATGSGPIGALVAVGRRLGRSDLRRKAAVLADIKGQSIAISTAIQNAVKTFVSKASRPARQLSQKSLLNSGFSVNYDTKEVPKNRQQAFRNVAANLERLQQDPDLLIERMAKSTARVSPHAPMIAQEMHNTLISATNFLADKLPKDPSTQLMFKREYQPSSIEMAKFERYMQAVEHPLSVFEDMERGMLTREHVEALKAVYPALYSELQQQVLNDTAGQQLDYSKKMQLGILLDVPTDPSLQPQNIAGLQAQFMPQNDPMQVEAQQGAMRMGSQTGLQNLSVANRAQTDVQQVQGRKHQG